MKAHLRNAYSVVRRFKMATLLNIIGLSLAFFVFMLLIIQVYYDITFDSHQKNAQSIFRMEVMQNNSSLAIVCRPFANAFVESSPHIEGGCIMAAWTDKLQFNIDQNGEQVSYKEDSWNVSPEIMNVFQFDMVEGTDQSLDEPNSVIIPKSLAIKLFGDESAVNRRLEFPIPNIDAKIVKGVFNDFPRNTSLKNVIYTSMHPRESYDDWENWSYFFFVRLDKAENKETVLLNFKNNFNLKEVLGDELFGGDENSFNFCLTSLPQIHFLHNVDFDTFPKASRQVILVQISIALIILIIAGINFTNFSMALIPIRIKSINTQKVLGSSEIMLRISLLMEAIFISVLAYFISLGLLYIAQKTRITLLIDADISFGMQSLIIGSTGFISIIVGILSGLYPSIYITSFQPSMVLKGSIGKSPSNRKTKNYLIGLQFIASFILIIASTYIYLQNEYMLKSPMGYNKEEIAIVHLNNNINKNRDSFENLLTTSADVLDVTYSQFLLSSQDQYMGWGRSYNDNAINFQCLPVSSSFLNIMEIKLTEGRDFRLEDELKETGCYIFNEKARSQFDLRLNEKIDGAEIIGFIPDINFASFRQEVTPMAFYLWGKNQWGAEEIFYNTAYVKFKSGSDLRVGIERIYESLKLLDDKYPFEVHLYDEVLNQTYKHELKIGSLIALFSFFAIFVSIVGVFGLVVLEGEYKRKEIAIRKVYGSTTKEILNIFILNYVKILMFCFIPSSIIALYSIGKWLENFAYRTPMYWWVLPIVFLFVCLITMAAIVFQNWKIANENPVNNIK